ncbi:hypothetical protein VTN00DRAFT_1618 [Thermoascus crustaceus]|uniref:uncharacterized protein n=1 Tax=Thermoascus crustaceus TaxID=5088 RepID=UPI003742BF68
MAALAAAHASRVLRVCGISGSTLDRRHGFTAAASAQEQIDIIIGDWMSEGNMPSTQARKLSRIENGKRQEFGYEKSFLNSIEPALSTIAKKGIKVIVDAGASDTEALCTKVQEMTAAQALSLKVAWISGDEVLPQVQAAIQGGTTTVLTDISTGRPLGKLPFEPIYIAQALESGANIVICGRVSGASLLQDISLSAQHMLREGTSLDLNRSLVKRILDFRLQRSTVITKIQNTGGAVTRDTVAAQLVYEIQGPYYYNSDVTARLDHIALQNISPDRVKDNGVIALPPPSTTKVGLTSQPRYQAELHWSLVGLDIEAKAALLERNIRDSLGEAFISKLHTIYFSTHGVAELEPYAQDRATVDFRVFVQTKDKQDLSYEKWIQSVLNVIMCSYPGATFQPTAPSTKSLHQTQDYPAQQPSYDPENPVDLTTFGETIHGPLGWIVHAPSGDKGNNANVGFWVRSSEYEWLRSLLTVPFLKKLLGGEYREGGKIDRFELPGLWAIHFLLHDYLDGGYNSTRT